MAKVVIFSRQFQQGHPHAGQCTEFVERFIAGVDDARRDLDFVNYRRVDGLARYGDIKRHTIRKGSGWKVGDVMSARVWSGKPYHSKQVKIAPDMEVVQVYDVQMHIGTAGNLVVYLDGHRMRNVDIFRLAYNDGLRLDDFVGCLGISAGKIFSGQVICWGEVSYS